MTSISGPNSDPTTRTIAPETTDAKPVSIEMSRADFQKSVFEQYKDHFRIPNSDIDKVFDGNDLNHSGGLDASEKKSAFEAIYDLIMIAIEKAKRAFGGDRSEETSENNAEVDENGNALINGENPEEWSVYIGRQSDKGSGQSDVVAGFYKGEKGIKGKGTYYEVGIAAIEGRDKRLFSKDSGIGAFGRITF